MEQLSAGSAALSGTEIFERTCYEFTKILYEYTEKEKDARKIETEMYENRIAVLESRCREYEAQIIQSNGFGGQLEKKYRKQDNKKQRRAARKNRIRALCFRIGKSIFRFGRMLAGKCGLKEKIKKSVLFKKLYLKGTIDKLRG